MPLTPAERLTRRFYDWEIRGRGWQVFPEPVTPEPPFVPFVARDREPACAAVDDGRRSTLGSWLMDCLRGRGNTGRAPTPEFQETPAAADTRGEVAHLSVVLPGGINHASDLAEQFLLNLTQCRHPVCLEFLGRPRTVTVGLAFDASEEALGLGLLRSHFPEAIAAPSPDLLGEHWDPNLETRVVDWALAEEFMLPLRTYRSLVPDPLMGLVSALGSLRDGELACVQVLLQPVRHPWAESVRRAVVTPEGKDFFADAPWFARQTDHKLLSPLCAVVMRGMAQSPSRGRGREILRNLTGALAVAENLGGNRLVPLNNRGYEHGHHVLDVLRRRSRRTGMLLSLQELLTFVHLPGASVADPALLRAAARTKPAPAVAHHGEIVLGENSHAGQTVAVRQGVQDRLRHTYVVGASGSGKSTLLTAMMKQDLEGGRGFAVLDPHGDLIDQVLGYVPEDRFDDVVLLDLSDEEFPVPFNILSAHSELEKTLLASDLAAAFARLATSWGDQMTTVLSNAILAFLESDRGGTLADLRRFLVERPFRESFLPTVTDPEIAYYWRNEFPLITGRPQVSVITRLNTFLRPKPIRHMVCHGENRLDIPRLMDEGKVLLARISQGAIGEENAYLLGTLLVSGFQRAAMARQQTEAAERRPFVLYIDEAHHFITPSMASILAGSRKYGLGLVLANQGYQQLESRDPSVASAVLTNAATRICFRLGDQDAFRFASGFAGFNAADLQNLRVGHAVCRLGPAENDFNLRVPLPAKVDEGTATRREAEIRRRSRARYAVPRGEVEQRLAEARGVITPEPKRDRSTARSANPPVPAIEPPPAVTTAASPTTSIVRPESPPPHSVPQLPPATPAPQPPSTPGRGGPQHKTIQMLIKRWAEGMGYRAQIEESVLHGKGAVDIVLRKGDVSIACEISLTTPTEYECGNVSKCLLAGFTHVVMICDDAEKLEKIRTSMQLILEKADLARVKFVVPPELFRFIEEHEKEAAGKDSIRGYRVTVNRSKLGAEARSHRIKSIKRTIAEAALRRDKGNRPGKSGKSEEYPNDST